MNLDDLLTPTVLIDEERVRQNILGMQTACDAAGVALWPHVKTHKMVEVARMQLDAGAPGLTCAKVSEAEALLASGVRRMFIANSIVDVRLAERLRGLAGKLDELMLAATSLAQAEALVRVLGAAKLRLPILVGVDTGNGREGARGVDAAVELATFVRGQSATMELRGIYTHEGQTYSTEPPEVDAKIPKIAATLRQIRERVGDAKLEVWTGCSVTGAKMTAKHGVTAVRPGTYVFGDLSLAARHKVMQWDDLAATVLATVVDRPTAELALVDAGSKTLFSDHTRAGIYASLFDGRDAHVTKCSEEHGWMTGPDVDQLQVGERVRLVPAHVCPMINLHDTVTVIRGEDVVGTWKVAARGCVQ